MKYLDELKVLELPKGSFAIFGSGPLAVRGIRESDDMDIIVTQGAWDALAKKYPSGVRENPERLALGNIEIFKDWPNIAKSIGALIRDADDIGGIPFVRLADVAEWKTNFNRPKDVADLELIAHYMASQKDS